MATVGCQKNLVAMMGCEEDIDSHLYFAYQVVMIYQANLALTSK